MMGKSLNKRQKKTTIKSQITNTLAFYPFIHLTWYQKVSSTIINLQK